MKLAALSTQSALVTLLTKIHHTQGCKIKKTKQQELGKKKVLSFSIYSIEGHIFRGFFCRDLLFEKARWFDLFVRLKSRSDVYHTQRRLEDFSNEIVSFTSATTIRNALPFKTFVTVHFGHL